MSTNVAEAGKRTSTMPPEHLRRDKMDFRVRDDERDLIVDAARTAKMPVAVYIRETMLDSARRRVARARSGGEA